MAAILMAIAAFSFSFAADKMPAELAGSIGEPSGKIAFLREKSVWVLDIKTGRQEEICDVNNGDGRLAWSADNREILFTRSGTIDLKGPDNMGGIHKVYDLFKALLDSAYSNNRFFWLRITDDLGSRDPEWSADGKRIVFWRDMNANYANAFEPNYQICTMNPDGSDIELLRKDWQVMADVMMQPTMNAQGDVAFVAFYERMPKGLVVLRSNEYMVHQDSIRARSERHLKKVAPCWSPDGSWIAYVNNDQDNPGIFITNPNLSVEYLVFVPPVGTSLYTISPSFSPDS
ncbi:MAG: PD40 domain-containing protein, partial [candidate division Zixibacteria bacterium]|nr:PD40 domain-containing protein [candidate division Zixibacteria bacterium]